MSAKTLVFAYHDIGCAGIEALLAAGYQIDAVFTHADDARENRFFGSVAQLCAQRGIPVHAPEDVNHPLWIARIRELQPQFIFSFYYRHLLGEELLACARRGAFNLHGSLLPRYRGRAPANWVLVNGESETGVTLHRMVKRADAGAIIAQQRVAIDAEDTALSLHGKLREAAGELLDRLLPAMLGAGMSLAGTLLATGAWADDTPPKNYGIDIKITAESEDDRDLGTAHGGDLNGIGLDLRPWAFGQWGQWSAYVMGQAVAATDTIQTDTLQSDEVDTSGRDSSDHKREPDDAYLALREFWVDYAGLTQYPGEHLRFGRQRLRDDSGMWQDTNIEALNWTFDTTLLRAHLGAAQRFSEYRTDITDLAPEDEDRTHVFGDISTQWAPHHWVGLRLHHSDDSGNLPDPGETIDSLDKRSTGDLTWVGIEANGDGYNYRSQMPLNYWASATWLSGNRDRLTSAAVDGERVATGKQSGDVNAYGVDLGLRWNIDEQWRAGVGYARGSGGGHDGEDQYEQTGLQSNRSNFTGTRARVHRFGEAFRGELSNLQDATVFGAWQLRDDYDASVVYHKFWRVDGDSDIGNSGITAPLENNSKDIGQEVDLVVTKYFKQGLLPASMSQYIDEPSALVRFRGGVFKPGDAYGSHVDSTMHHAFVDFIWRF